MTLRRANKAFHWHPGRERSWEAWAQVFAPFSLSTGKQSPDSTINLSSYAVKKSSKNMNFLELTSSGKRGYHWEDPMQSMICCAVAVVLSSWMKCIFNRSRRKRQREGKRKTKHYNTKMIKTRENLKESNNVVSAQMVEDLRGRRRKLKPRSIYNYATDSNHCIWSLRLKTRKLPAVSRPTTRASAAPAHVFMSAQPLSTTCMVA